jgi:hypothetical protein
MMTTVEDTPMIAAGPPQGDRPLLQEGARDAAQRLAWGRIH